MKKHLANFLSRIKDIREQTRKNLKEDLRFIEQLGQAYNDDVQTLVQEMINVSFLKEISEAV